MAYKWPDLDPDEIQDYSMDWSRVLGDDTITSVIWIVDGIPVTSYSVTNGLNVLQPTNTNTVTTVRLTSGNVGQRYKITCRALTANGIQHDRSAYLTIRER